jgi:hypothetical protein
MTQVQFQVILRQTACQPVRLGAILISLFDIYIVSSLCRAPSPSPMNRMIQPEVKVKSQSYVSVERNF